MPNQPAQPKRIRARKVMDDRQKNKCESHPLRIYEKFWNGGSQDLRYEAHFEINGEKFRVSIRRNAYDMQSSVKGLVLDGRQWSVLVEEAITNHPSVAKHSYINHVDKYPNMIDDFRLVALEIVGTMAQLFTSS